MQLSKQIGERHDMPLQDPEIRRSNFEEVALGYDDATALEEAKRCLNCKARFCVKGCPVEIDIPEFIQEIVKGNLPEAYKILKNKNNLPAVCGRVCPQEVQCEDSCILAKKGVPIAIGRLERYVADWARKNVRDELPEKMPQGEKVAVIGAGPSGLTCAGDLAKMGYLVTVFEALHTPGGVLMYGIPEFRLPKEIVRREIAQIEMSGVTIKTGNVIGKLFTVEELLENGFDAVYISTGAGLPYFMEIPGENLNGVYSANEFLTRTNLMCAYEFPNACTPIKVGKKVAVVGAGNVAMDAARTALRLGADESHIIYRRSRKEMPARVEELEHAEEEGVIFNLLASPVEIIGDETGKVSKIKCVRYELGEPDASGRQTPVEIPGSEFEMEVDSVIMAIGQGPNPLVTRTTEGLDLNKKGTIKASEETGETSIPGVFAGGDIVTGAATVILAMGAGKKAARAIDQYIKNKKK